MKLKTVITAYDITDTASLTPEQVPIALTVGTEGVKADPVERTNELGVDVTLESAATDMNGSSTSSSIEKDVIVGADAINLKNVAYSKQVIALFSIAGLEEAPLDDNIYGRKNGEWQEIDTITNDERQQIKTNTANITTNTTNIAKNTASIATNTTNIATNKANIATNTTNIATNKANIATNTTNIAKNAASIAANAGNIKTLQDTCITDAPSDGKQYARKDGEWVEVTGGGSGDVYWDD